MIIYTNAPPEYDYPYMEQIGTITDASGRVWRKLFTQDEYRCTNFQLPRYGSGLYVGCSEEVFLERFA